MGRRQTKRWLIGIIVTIILGAPFAVLTCFNVYDRVNKNTNVNEKSGLSDYRIIELHILMGETKKIDDKSSLIISLFEIIKDDSRYIIRGTLNDGHDTVSFNKKGQGESIEFPAYTIQIMKIGEEYAEFRIISSDKK